MDKTPAAIPERKDLCVVFIGALLDDFDPSASQYSFSPFIGIQYVASEVKNAGYEVKLFDQRLHPYDTIVDYITKNHDRILMVGFTVMTVQIKHSLKLSRTIKQQFPDMTIVWGGIHPTLYPEQVIKDESIDVVVCNEGVGAALELADSLRTESDLEGIKGVYFKKNNKIIRNKERELKDLDDYPWIDYNLLPMEKVVNVKLPHLGLKRTWHLNLSDGCPYRCTFCIVNVIKGKNRIRRKSLGRIKKEIEELKRDFNIEYLQIRDDNFLIDIEWAEKVATILGDLDMKWEVQGRIDFFKDRLTYDKLILLKSLGLTVIATGVESGSKKILKMLKKSIDPKDVLDAAKVLSKVGLIGGYSFMIGLPEESIEDMNATADLITNIVKIAPYSRIAGPMLLRPYPGGELFEQLQEYGYHPPDSLDGWASPDLDMRRGMSIKKMCWLGKKEKIHAIGINRFLIGYLYSSRKGDNIWSWFYKKISKYRVEHSFYKFSFEYELFTWAKKAGFLKSLNNILKREMAKQENLYE